MVLVMWSLTVVSNENSETTENHHSKSKESPSFLILGVPSLSSHEECHERMLRRGIKHFIEVDVVVIPEDERFSFLKERPTSQASTESI